MKKIINELKNESLTFLSLNIYIILSIFLPKSGSSIFNLPLRVIFTLALVGIIFYDNKKKNIRLNDRKLLPLIIIFAVFLFFTLLSFTKTYSLITSAYTVVKFFFLFCIFLFVYKVEFSKREYELIFYNLFICIFISTLLGFGCYITGINIMTGRGSGVDYYPGAKGRINTTFFNTIYYGIFLDMVVPLLFYFIYKEDNKKKLVCLICLLGMVYANLIMTFTRSTFIVFFGMLFILVVLLNKKFLKLRSLIIIVVIASVSFLIPGSQSFIKKTGSDIFVTLENIADFLPGVSSKETEIPSDYSGTEETEYVDLSLQHRKSFADIAKMIANDYKYTGVGFGTYIEYMRSKEFDQKYPNYELSKTHPHSTLLLMNAEVGIIALVVFIIIVVIMILISFACVVRTFKKKNESYSIYSLAFATICGFTVIGFLMENSFYDTQVSYLLFLFYALFLNYAKKYEKDNGLKKVLFISSTGGHLDELLQLKLMFEKYDYHIITEKTKSNLSLLDKYPGKVNFLAYGSYTKPLSKIVYPFKLLYNTFKSFIIYLKIHPKYIISTGAHTSGPMLLIGKILGSKIIYIETFANSNTKSKTGSIVYKFADLFIVQWKSMLKLYPNAVYGGWIF